MNNNKVELFAIKTKIPNDYWLNYIRENLYYENGQVFSRNSAYKKSLGSKNSSKYLCVNLEPKRLIPRNTLNIKLHHLVWFLNNDEWSDVELDHIDRNIYNNNISNLRKSNRIQQCLNKNNFGNKDYNLRYIQHVKSNNSYRIVKSRKVVETAKSLEEAIIKRDNLKL